MKKRWFEHIENPATIEAIFQRDIPDLIDVTVKQICFDSDGPIINMKFDLKDYPKNPPVKWQKNDFNVVALELQFIEVTDINLVNWATTNVSTMNVEKQVDLLTVSLSELISFKCGWIYLSKVSAYQKGSIDNL